MPGGLGVARALGLMGEPAPLPLLRVLRDGNEASRKSAVAALIAIGTPAAEPVVSALDDPDGDVRKRAADVLVEIGDTRAIAPLERIFDDEDWHSRIP